MPPILMVAADYGLTKSNTCCNQGRIQIQNRPMYGHEGFLPKRNHFGNKDYLKLDIIRFCLNP